MNFKSKYLIPSLLMFLFFILLPYNAKSQSAQDVTIGYSALRISLPIFVAQEKGFFAKEGLNVKLERFETAQPMMESLVAGNIQVAGYTALPITYSAMHYCPGKISEKDS